VDSIDVVVERCTVLLKSFLMFGVIDCRNRPACLQRSPNLLCKHLSVCYPAVHVQDELAQTSVLQSLEHCIYSSALFSYE
jgi:hypothetical protein